MRSKFIVLSSLFLIGCGGGGGGGASVPIVPSPPPIPTLGVTLVPSVSTLNVSEDSTVGTFKIDATYTGDSTDPIVPVLALDSNLLQIDGAITQSGKTFSATLKSKDGLAVKQHKSTVQFRLCKEAGCTTVYPGSTASFEHTIEVSLANWTTRQRNAAHNGYVRLTLDPTKFSKSWEFISPTAISIEPIAAQAGSVFTTVRNNDGSTSSLALNGNSGAQLWRYNFGNIHHASGPAIVGNQLIFSTMQASSTNNQMTVLNASTGQFARNFIFASQWSTFAQPTPSGDNAYIASGYYGNVVYGYDLKAGRNMFEVNGSGGKSWDGQTPAVDSKYIYYYSGNLDVFDRTTGALVKSIPDPFWTWNGYSYGGTPMISSDNNVIAFSGNGQGTYNVSFPLVNFNIQTGVHRWRTTERYDGHPAAAKGVIYAWSNEFGQLSAIEEATGKVLWAWPLPAGQQFLGNIIVTENLLFLSTTSGIYAIDLAGTRQTVWTAPTPGWIAITPDAKLVVNSYNLSPVKLTSYSLR